LLCIKRLNTTANQLQIDIRTIGCFNNFTSGYQVTLLNDTNFTLGIGSGNFPFYIGCFCGGHG
jgi:hypothetical protein